MTVVLTLRRWKPRTTAARYGGRFQTGLPSALEAAASVHYRTYDTRGHLLSFVGSWLLWCSVSDVPALCGARTPEVAKPGERWFVRCMYSARPEALAPDAQPKKQ